jgi:hypothetical protein
MAAAAESASKVESLAPGGDENSAEQQLNASQREARHLHSSARQNQFTKP